MPHSTDHLIGNRHRTAASRHATGMPLRCSPSNEELQYETPTCTEHIESQQCLNLNIRMTLRLPNRHQSCARLLAACSSRAYRILWVRCEVALEQEPHGVALDAQRWLDANPDVTQLQPANQNSPCMQLATYEVCVLKSGAWTVDSYSVYTVCCAGLGALTGTEAVLQAHVVLRTICADKRLVQYTAVLNYSNHLRCERK